MSANPVSRHRALEVAPSPAARSVTIEWGVSRRAMGAHAPTGNAPLLTLRYDAAPGEPERWSLIDPVSSTREDLPQSVLDACSVPEIQAANGHVHLRSPMMYAFVSIDRPDAPELLYARTTIFSILGIAGGRYQPRGAAVVLGSHTPV